MGLGIVSAQKDIDIVIVKISLKYCYCNIMQQQTVLNKVVNTILVQIIKALLLEYMLGI
jgi:hypothetical protein